MRNLRITAAMQKFLRTIIPLYVLVSALVLLTDWATLSDANSLTREQGSVETMSCIGYLVAAALYVIAAGRHSFWPIPTLLTLMALREFDADKRFTTEGILSTKIFVRDTALWEKGVAAVVWIVLLWAIYALVRHRAVPYLSAVRTGKGWAWAVSAGLFIAAFSKTIDGLGRKLAPMGVSLSSDMSAGAAHVEEGLEFFIPVLFMVAILLKRRPQKA